MFYRKEIDIVGQSFCILQPTCVLKKRFFSMKIKRRRDEDEFGEFCNKKLTIFSLI